MSFRNSNGTSFHVFHSLRPKAVRILQHIFASRLAFTMKIFAEPFFCFDNTITLVSIVSYTLFSLSATLRLSVLARVNS